MTIQDQPPRGRGTRQKKALGVQAILEWAFCREKVQLELPDPRGADDRGTGFGLEYVLMQRAQLGCRIDGGGRSEPHEDAEVIAATLANLPEDLGGQRMAVRVAELARAGLTPDWMPGVVPRCVPVEVTRNQHGVRAKTEVVDVVHYRSRRRWRRVEVRACPVVWSPDRAQIDAARRGYEDWWRALAWVRDGLQAGSMLAEYVVGSDMPVKAPWSSAQWN